MKYIDIALPLFIQLATFLLGFFVLLRNPKRFINQVFAVLALFYVFWVFSVFMADISRTQHSAYFWTQMSIVGPILLGPVMYVFSLVFPTQNKKISKFKKILLVLLPAIMMAFVPTKYNVTSVELKSWGTDFVPGLLYTVLLGYLGFFYGSALFTLGIKIKKAESKLEKKAIFFVLLAAAVTVVLGIITNVILPSMGFAVFSRLGPSISILCFVLLVGYAITRESLFDIKIVFVELLATLVFAISLFDALISDTFQLIVIRLIASFLLLLASLFFVRNIMTELKRKEELEIVNVQLRKLDEAKSDFVSIASHQLRTPLTTSNGFLSMIFDGQFGKIPKNLVMPLERVNNANKRLLNLVEDLLNVTRIESGKMTFEFTFEKVEDLLEELFESFELQANGKGLRFSLLLPENKLDNVSIDRNKIREAVSNVIDNAIKYTKEGSVVMNAKSTGNAIQIIVSDTGIGIAKEDLNNVFNKFSRGSKQRKIEAKGTGIGLYFGKKVVEANNGKMWAESEGIGKGSRFVIEIPVKPVQA